MVARAVMLDIAGLKKVDALPSNYGITVADIDAAMADHGDLYRDEQLHIDAGTLHLDSIHATGYGYASPPETASRTPEHDWSWPDD